MKWPNLVQLSIQLDVLGIFSVVVVTVPVSLPEWENDIIFSNKQACIQSEVGPRKSRYGFQGSAISSKQGPGRNHGQNQTFETLPWHKRTQIFTMEGVHRWWIKNFLKGHRARGQGRSKMKQTLKQNVKLAYIRVQFLTFSCTKFRI